uniref:Tudor-knot domain-containing protein n=1 Tax=Panagrolaimus davidi TaxID=227884 RepID=A0A914QM50_9BILA
MANKKKQPADANDNVNGVASLKIKRSTKSPTQERSTPSSLSDEQNVGRLIDSLPRFVLDEYEINTQVICQYSDSHYYDAKIVKKRKLDNEEFLYTIHYNGWNQRYDEEITHAAAQEKFFVYSPENLAIAKVCFFFINK